MVRVSVGGRLARERGQNRGRECDGDETNRKLDDGRRKAHRCEAAFACLRCETPINEHANTEFDAFIRVLQIAEAYFKHTASLFGQQLV